MFESIINWIIANKDSLISNLVVTLFFIGVGKLWILKNRIPNAIKTLVNIKGIKYLGFIVVYILPLGTIAWMIVDKTNEPTFKNIALFIIICVSLIFNILMNHIRDIYKMINQLTVKNTETLNQVDKNFNSVYSSIIELKKNGN